MDKIDNLPNVLIVGTQPYNKMVQSRSFDSYFHYWRKENLAQVFSDARTPVKGQCETLYQITDKRLIKARTNKQDPGKIFHYDELPEEWTSVTGAHKSPKKKTPLLKLLRKMIWRKKYWNTPQFNKWLEDFKPEAVFISFSNDFFIFDLAFYVADKFNIPIIASVTDDYIFNGHFSLNPAYWIYRSKYKKTMKKLRERNPFWCFVAPRIEEKYKKEFGVRSQVQYIASEYDEKNLVARPSKEIRSVRYFGNLEYGRFDSICDIARAFREIGSDIKVDVYSKDARFIKSKILEKNPNIVTHDQIPYDEVVALSKETDLLLVVEGFRKEDVRTVRYSLSTKVADSLKMGTFVLGYGHKDTGAIDFLKSFDCAIVASSYGELKTKLKGLLANPSEFIKTIDKGLEVIKNNFNLDVEARKFTKMVQSLVEANKGN